MLFKDLQLIEPVLQALSEEGYTQPTPIQQLAIPHILAKRDLLACAQTGTGKTAAFALPILQMLHTGQSKEAGLEKRRIKALILTPTRELAIQIGENISAYGRHLRLKHLVIFGGVSQYHQVTSLQRGIDILVATPGRLLDLIQQGYVSLQHVSYLILDEADRMLDMGFVKDVQRIISRVPRQRQTLFFSATMPQEIQSLADSILNSPEKIEVAPPATTVELIMQSVYHVEKADKQQLLIHLLRTHSIRSALVFARTKHGADRIAKFLNKNNLSASAIHGDKSQGSRQAALTNFKEGKITVLVATDIAARGIDIDELMHVFNFELPNIPETYVHRIGRTGRAGASGIAISFCDREERPLLKDIQQLIRKSIPVVADHNFRPVQSTEIRQFTSPSRFSNSGNPMSGGRMQITHNRNNSQDSGKFRKHFRTAQ